MRITRWVAFFILILMSLFTDSGFYRLVQIYLLKIDEEKDR